MQVVPTPKVSHVSRLSEGKTNNGQYSSMKQRHGSPNSCHLISFWVCHFLRMRIPTKAKESTLQSPTALVQAQLTFPRTRLLRAKLCTISRLSQALESGKICSPRPKPWSTKKAVRKAILLLRRMIPPAMVEWSSFSPGQVFLQATFVRVFAQPVAWTTAQFSEAPKHSQGTIDAIKFNSSHKTNRTPFFKSSACLLFKSDK